MFHHRPLRHWSDKYFLDNLTDKFGSQINELWANFGSDFTYPGNLPSYVEDYFEELESRTTPTTRTISSHIQCLPQPGTSWLCLVDSARIAGIRSSSDDPDSHTSKRKICRSFSTVPRLIRLVDLTVRRVDSLPSRHAWERHSSVCLDIFKKQNGCAAIFSLQPSRCRLLHGCLSR